MANHISNPKWRVQSVQAVQDNSRWPKEKTDNWHLLKLEPADRRPWQGNAPYAERLRLDNEPALFNSRRRSMRGRTIDNDTLYVYAEKGQFKEGDVVTVAVFTNSWHPLP